MDAVVQEIAFGGRRRERCTKCNLVAYRSEEHAKMAAQTISTRTETTFTPFEGKCGLWHVSGGHHTPWHKRGRTSVRLVKSETAQELDINRMLQRAEQLDKVSRAHK